VIVHLLMLPASETSRWRRSSRLIRGQSAMRQPVTTECDYLS